MLGPPEPAPLQDILFSETTMDSDLEVLVHIPTSHQQMVMGGQLSLPKRPEHVVSGQVKGQLS